MIEQLKNSGIQRHTWVKSGYANASIQMKPDIFSMNIDGKEYTVENSEHRQSIKNFLSGGGAERRETVAAVLHKGIEPTKENLELIHSALNEDVFQAESGASVKEELDAEIIEKLDLPDDVKERIASSKDLVKTIKNLLSENYDFSKKEPDRLTLKELLISLIRRTKDSSRPHSGSTVQAEEGVLFDKAEHRFFDPKTGMMEMLEEAERGIVSEFSEKRNQTEQRIALHPEFGLKNEQAGMKDDLAEIGSEPLSGYKRGQVYPSVRSSMQKGGSAISVVTEHLRNQKEYSDKNGVEGLFSNQSLGMDVSFAREIPHFEQKKNVRNSSPNNRDSHNDLEVSRSERDRTETESVESAETESIDLEDMVNRALLMVDANLEHLFSDLEFKTFLVSKINQRMIDAKKEFDEMKNSVIHSLDKGSIAKAIEALTKSIQKSSFAMLTDMPTEKKLLVSLSRLEEAAAALNRKDFALAEKIVGEVRKLVEQIEFKPSSRKIQAMVFQKAQSTEKALQEKHVDIHDKIVEAIKLHSSGTARDLLELVRFSGINHEIEKYENSSGVGQLRNLKELFSDTSFSAMMSGEQMLNYSDDRRRRDFYVLDVPLQINDEIEGMKVFVGGKSDDNRLDWRNAELYFALKVNDDKIGLRFSIKNADVAIEVIGDREFRLDHLKEALPEIGYRLLSVKNSTSAKKAASSDISERRLPLQVAEEAGGTVRDIPDSRFDAKV